MINDLVVWQWVGLAAVLFVSSIIQGAIGFASALIAIPVMMWLGLELPNAVIIMAVVSGCQASSGWWKLRKEIDYRETVLPIIMRLAALPVGTFILWALNESFDKQQMRFFIGVLLAVIVTVLLVVRIPPRPSIPTWATACAFAAAGLMQGAVGMAGPPMVLWVMALDWSAKKTRAFLFFLLLVGVPVQLILFSISFPDRMGPAILAGLGLMPVVILGMLSGVWLGNCISKPLLKTLSYGFLILTASASILAPWIASENTDRIDHEPKKSLTLNGQAFTSVLGDFKPG